MGLLEKLFGGKKKEEEGVLKALEELDKAEANARDEGNLESLEDASDLEKQWLQRRTGSSETVGYGKEQEGGEDKEELEKEEGVSNSDSDNEDELISSLKKEEEKEEEEIDMTLKKEMDKLGDVSAREILDLGREALNDMRRGER